MTIAFGIVALYFFAGSVPEAEEIHWGVNFSKRHTQNLRLDWKAVYTALLDDLKAKKLKVSFDWDEIEPERGVFSFADADWQVAEAEKRGAQVTAVIGMKTMRWPECHVPSWAKDLSKQEQQKAVLELLEAVALRYKDSAAIWAWQVENEPLFRFGNCPWIDRKFFEKEVALVKSVDANRPIVASDSGELSFWIQAGSLGDIVSVTLYRKVWVHEINRYVTYPLPAISYGRKAQIIKTLFNTEVIVGELQAEPWGPGKPLYDTTIAEQNAAFDLAQFQKNIIFAKQTGISEFYLWGAEWWYWRKEAASDPAFWQEAQKLF